MKAEGNKRSSKWNKGSYINNIASLIRDILEQSEDLPYNLPSSYMTFLSIWLLSCLVVSTAYRGKMVSLLTFPVYDRIPATFDELATAREFDIDFHYFGNVGYAYFKSSTNPSFIKIFNKMGKEPDPVVCMRRTLNKKSACIIFIATYDELLHRNLSDQYGKSPLKFTPHRGAMFPAGVIHQYKAPLSENFRRILHPAMEAGLIPFWQREDLNRVLQNKNKWQRSNGVDIASFVWGTGNRVSDNLLRVRNLHGAFIIFGLGLITGSLSFLAEIIKRVLWSFVIRFVHKIVVKMF